MLRRAGQGARAEAAEAAASYSVFTAGSQVLTITATGLHSLDMSFRIQALVVVLLVVVVMAVVVVVVVMLCFLF